MAAFGGLDGVTAHLDHVAAFGADAVYLTPIFTSPSSHKYDTVDFDRVDPALGGEAAFDRLVAACRARSLGLVLDGVFNHVGQGHRWLARAPGLVQRQRLARLSVAARARHHEPGSAARLLRRGRALDRARRHRLAARLRQRSGPRLRRRAGAGGARGRRHRRRHRRGDGLRRRLGAPPGGRARRRHELLAARHRAGAGLVVGAGRISCSSALDRLAAEEDPPRACRRRGRCVGSHDTRAPGHRARRRRGADSPRARAGVRLSGRADDLLRRRARHARRRRSRQSPPAAPAADLGRRSARARRRRWARCAARSRRSRTAATCRWRSRAATSSPSRASPTIPPRRCCSSPTPRRVRSRARLFVALPLMLDALPLHDLLEPAAPARRMSIGHARRHPAGPRLRWCCARAIPIRAAIDSSNPC